MAVGVCISIRRCYSRSNLPRPQVPGKVGGLVQASSFVSRTGRWPVGEMGLGWDDGVGVDGQETQFRCFKASMSRRPRARA